MDTDTKANCTRREFLLSTATAGAGAFLGASALYEPYREVGGDEETNRELFLNARLPGYFPPHPVEVRSGIGQVELLWHPQNGKASFVEAADAPGGAWTTITVPISITNSTARWQEPPASTNRFYRIRFE